MKNTDNMELVDTHSHIYLPEFAEDRDEVVARAVAAGVGTIILPNVDMQTVAPMLELCSRYPALCHPAMALHPTEVREDYRQVLQTVEQELATGRYAAVGECGIDLYWDQTFRREQLDAFAQHLRWASQFRLPVIIHCREAFEEVMQTVESMQDGSLSGVFHCFSGTPDEARRVLDAGFMLGIGGVVTYKKSQLPDVVRAAGIEHLLLETDSPYLAPVPFRGRRNESAHVLLVAQKVAEAAGCTVEAVAEATTRQAKAMFLGNNNL